MAKDMKNKIVTKETFKKYWKNHRIFSIIFILFALIFVYRAGVFFFVPAVQDADPVINVRATEAAVESIALTSPLTGRVQPVEEVAIIPMAAGRVTAVHVAVGDQVSAGDLLFEIDKGQVSASYNQAKEAYDSAASAFKRMELLYSEGAISKQDFESAQMQYISAKESFNAAANAYGYYNVTSPIDGYVTSLSVSVGTTIGQTMAASVANIDELIIETTVSEALASKVKTGEKVDVYIDSLDKMFVGTITSFSPIPSMGTLTYPLTITMDPSQDLFAGMFAEVRLLSEQVEMALCIPSEAVMIKNGIAVVAVVDSQGFPSFKEVTTGIDNGEKVEILSGLSEGERVIYSGQQYVAAGVQVNLVEE